MVTPLNWDDVVAKYGDDFEKLYLDNLENGNREGSLLTSSAAANHFCFELLDSDHKTFASGFLGDNGSEFFFSFTNEFVNKNNTPEFVELLNLILDSAENKDVFKFSCDELYVNFLKSVLEQVKIKNSTFANFEIKECFCTISFQAESK